MTNRHSPVFWGLLAILIAALAVRYFTSRKREALEIQKTEVDNENRLLISKINQHLEARREAEDRLRIFQSERGELEHFLELAEEELDERIERNEELEGH